MEGSVQTIAFKSTILDTELDLQLYIPPNYHENIAYNIAITGDGQDFFKLGKIDQQMETFILEESGPDTIVVGVPYPRVSTRRLWYAPLGEQKDDYIRFLKDELLPFLSERYHLLGSAEGRLLLGDSLSASLTLMACIQEPDTFQRAVMFSPYVDDTLLSLVANSDDLHRFTVYHTLGNKENEVKATDGRILDFVTMNEQLHAALDGTLKHYQYKVIEAGNHTWFTWAPELPHALDYHWS